MDSINLQAGIKAASEEGDEPSNRDKLCIKCCNKTKGAVLNPGIDINYEQRKVLALGKAKRNRHKLHGILNNDQRLAKTRVKRTENKRTVRGGVRVILPSVDELNLTYGYTESSAEVSSRLSSGGLFSPPSEDFSPDSELPTKPDGNGDEDEDDDEDDDDDENDQDGKYYKDKKDNQDDKDDDKDENGNEKDGDSHNNDYHEEDGKDDGSDKSSDDDDKGDGSSVTQGPKPYPVRKTIEMTKNRETSSFQISKNPKGTNNTPCSALSAASLNFANLYSAIDSTEFFESGSDSAVAAYLEELTISPEEIMYGLSPQELRVLKKSKPKSLCSGENSDDDISHFSAWSDLSINAIKGCSGQEELSYLKDLTSASDISPFRPTAIGVLTDSSNKQILHGTAKSLGSIQQDLETDFLKSLKVNPLDDYSVKCSLKQILSRVPSDLSLQDEENLPRNSTDVSLGSFHQFFEASLLTVNTTFVEHSNPSYSMIPLTKEYYKEEHDLEKTSKAFNQEPIMYNKAKEKPLQISSISDIKSGMNSGEALTTSDGYSKLIKSIESNKDGERITTVDEISTNLNDLCMDEMVTTPDSNTDLHTNSSHTSPGQIFDNGDIEDFLSSGFLNPELLGPRQSPRFDHHLEEVNLATPQYLVPELDLESLNLEVPLQGLQASSKNNAASPVEAFHHNMNNHAYDYCSGSTDMENVCTEEEVNEFCELSSKESFPKTSRPRSSKMFTMCMREKPYSPPKPSWYVASYGNSTMESDEDASIESSTTSRLAVKSAGGMPVSSIYLCLEKGSEIEEQDREKLTVSGTELKETEVAVQQGHKEESQTENPLNVTMGNWKDKYTEQVEQNFAGCFDDIDDFIQEFNAKTEYIVENAVVAAASAGSGVSRGSFRSGRTQSSGRKSRHSINTDNNQLPDIGGDQSEEALSAYSRIGEDEHGSGSINEKLEESSEPSIGRSEQNNQFKATPCPNLYEDVIEELAQEIGTLKSTKSSKSYRVEPNDIEVVVGRSGGRLKNIFQAVRGRVRRHFSHGVV